MGGVGGLGGFRRSGCSSWYLALAYAHLGESGDIIDDINIGNRNGNDELRLVWCCSGRGLGRRHMFSSDRRDLGI